MRETLSHRVARIIAGSFHGVVGAVENAMPGAVMEQSIRELESALADVRADLGAVEAQRHLTAKRLAEESQRHDELTERSGIAVAEGREDLAAAAIECQLDIEAQLPVLEMRLAELAESRTRLEGFVGALKAKRREMQSALDAFRRQQLAAASSEANEPLRSGQIELRSERAEAAFDRVHGRQTGLRGLRGAGLDQAARLGELEALARQTQVEERLARLKGRVES